eukprot:UN03844
MDGQDRHVPLNNRDNHSPNQSNHQRSSTYCPPQIPTNNNNNNNTRPQLCAVSRLQQDAEDERCLREQQILHQQRMMRYQRPQDNDDTQDYYYTVSEISSMRDSAKYDFI